MNCDISNQTTAHVTALHYYSKKQKHKIAIYKEKYISLLLYCCQMENMRRHKDDVILSYLYI
jgi:hypothetical protein